MLPEVRRKIKKAIEKQIKNKNTNWSKIQKIAIKDEWGVPFGWNTLRKYVKSETFCPTTKNQKAILDYYSIPCVIVHNVVKLK